MTGLTSTIVETYSLQVHRRFGGYPERDVAADVWEAGNAPRLTAGTDFSSEIDTQAMC